MVHSNTGGHNNTIMKEMTESKKRLIIRLHTICSNRGIEKDERKLMYESFGATSSTEMDENEIQELINLIVGHAQNLNNRTDLLRKRCLAVVFHYYKLRNINANAQYVKATLVRASGYKSFNAIPDAILMNLYNAFRDKNKTIVSVAATDKVITEYLTTSN